MQKLCEHQTVVSPPEYKLAYALALALSLCNPIFFHRQVQAHRSSLVVGGQNLLLHYHLQILLFRHLLAL